MKAVKIGKLNITVLTGNSNDSYSTTIKKLTFLQELGFIQIVPARLVGGLWHLQIALEHTFDSFGRGTNIAKTPALEFLVRLFGERQVGRALEKAQFGNEDLVLVCEEKMKKEVKELDFWQKKLNFEKSNGNLMAEKTALTGL